MRHKKSDIEIGEDSDCYYYNTTKSTKKNAQFQFQSQSNFTVKKPHLSVQIPEQTNQIISQDVLFPNSNFNSSSITQSFYPSSTHKRPIMIQSQLRTQKELPFSVTHHHQQQSNATKLLFWFTSCANAVSPFTHKLYHSVCHACLLRFHFRFLILISLPSLYFFIYNPRRLLLFALLSIVAFSLVLLVSVNLAIPRLPSLRLLLARSLPNKFVLPKKPANPVVWSIGSKPKTEKKPNSGCWVQVYSNGDVYEGEFHKGKCSGSGVYYYSIKGKYEGDWIDGKYDGYGVETWARGSRYRGQYRQGLRHGIGVYRFYTGDVYAGEWSNGQCHGTGIHTCEDGSKYVGEFKWGVKHGLGHYHFRNGDTYVGEYFADKMHGFGIYLFANGHRYEGAWHEGRRQGLGMYTFRNGETQSGHWQNGILDVSSSDNIQPGSPFAVSHSKVLNTVKEARQASEKAYSLPNVEERVNRAIQCANKAANAARVAAVKAVQRRMLDNDNEIIQDDCSV